VCAGSEDDRAFYAFPRFVKHVDDSFLRQLTELYRQRLPAGSAILELGASHISHLPTDVAYVRAAACSTGTEDADVPRASCALSHSQTSRALA
jgi:hypothetical protein